MEISKPTNFDKPLMVGAPLIQGTLGIVGPSPVGPQLHFTGEGDGIIAGNDAYRSSGGIIENVGIIRAGTVSGGDAITLKADSSEFRAGNTTIRRVLIMGLTDLQGGPTVQWNRGLVIDGSKMTTPGGAGIRVTNIDGLRISSCMNDFVFLNNAVHFHAKTLQVDPGLSDKAVVRIRNGQSIFFTGANIFGEVIIEEQATNVVLDGFIDTVTIRSKAKNIVVNGVVNKLNVEKGATGRSNAHVATVNNKSTGFWISGPPNSKI